MSIAQMAAQLTPHKTNLERLSDVVKVDWLYTCIERHTDCSCQRTSLVCWDRTQA